MTSEGQKQVLPFKWVSLSNVWRLHYTSPRAPEQRQTYAADGAAAAFFSILITVSRNRLNATLASVAGCLLGCPVFLIYVAVLVWHLREQAKVDLAGLKTSHPATSFS